MLGSAIPGGEVTCQLVTYKQITYVGSYLGTNNNDYFGTL
jgi:hypothetical protein